jgi:hypothetical protein
MHAVLQPLSPGGFLIEGLPWQVAHLLLIIRTKYTRKWQLPKVFLFC